MWVQVVKAGHVGLVLELLLAGANPNVADPACGLTVLHDTSRDGYEDAVETLLERGADANMVDNGGNLPLHLAAAEGHLEVVQMLLGKTGNPQQKNNQGATALQLAGQQGKVDTVQYLLEHFSPRESSASSARAFSAFFSRPKTFGPVIIKTRNKAPTKLPRVLMEFSLERVDGTRIGVKPARFIKLFYSKMDASEPAVTCGRWSERVISSNSSNFFFFF